ncbi:MAG: hypothetical protein O9266_04150 [Porphyrobacter sp.]|jgi:hypothetical protein|nr:hypothetical protein [Porphyrobacter sp.]
MIGKVLWPALLLALAVVTGFLQIDRQADLTPSLAPLVPQGLRNYAQPRIAAIAADGSDSALALEEAKRLVQRRPVPAEHLTLLAVAQTKAGELEQAGLTIQIAAQRGWREPIAQEAVLRLALDAGDKPEAARRFAALFLRDATPNALLEELAPAVLDEAGGPGQGTLVDIISGTDRWHDTFLRRGGQVMPPPAFADIAVGSMARGTRFDCAVLSQTLKGLRQKDEASAARVAAAAPKDCPQTGA